MRIAIVASVFIASLLPYGETEDVFAKGPITRRDSIAIAEHCRAISDFERNVLTIPKYRVTCNYFYAEEILYQRYGLKVDMHVFESFCGTGMEETWFKEKCYEDVIDSLMYAKYGRDIYERLSNAGDSLAAKFPDRYEEDKYGLMDGQSLYNDDSVHAALVKHIKYPETARKDSVQGVVYLWVQYDSTGNVVATSVMKSVRGDLDTAAMEGAMHIGAITPQFRWGNYQPGKFALPVKFTLK